VFYRAHYFVQQPQADMYTNQVIDVTQYEDMNELLVASDVLISDYSSSLWDFTLTQRPSFVYAPDLDEYQHQDRDFAYPLEAWPYPIAQSEVELMDLILTFDAAVFGTRIQEHQKVCGSYDKGCASYEVAKLITKTILKEGGN
jgi:CDP-glycerol glycerophosphotransferase